MSLLIIALVHAEGHLPALVNADPSTVASFESRQLLELLAAVLHVPSLHAAQLMATGALPPQYTAPQIESAFMSTLLTGQLFYVNAGASREVLVMS